MGYFVYLVILSVSKVVLSESLSDCDLISEFPEGFNWGAASAAYQIEGAWDLDGKGESIWDHGTHEFPEKIIDRSNGDVAANSYQFYQEDVKALKKVGFKFYRFSISWPRILPNGELQSLNIKGLEYYHRLIDELLANGIEPVVTLYHWDLPQSLQLYGGFLNRIIVEYFEIYADVIFENFGDKVKKWITFNEPWEVCVDSYEDGSQPPFIEASGRGGYLCAHHLLLSHARAYHLYQNKYKTKQNGRIGISINGRGNLAKTNTEREVLAVERNYQFNIGWYGHPIFSKIGGYPQVMIDTIASNSIAEGFQKSRLPKFTEDEIEYIKGTADFLGFNYYTSRYVDMDPELANQTASYAKDIGIKQILDPSWKRAKSNWLYCVPEGFRSLLNWLKNEYDNPEIWITENGWSDEGELNDADRISYHDKHLRVLLQSIYCDKIRLTTYTVWSIIDNFEWMYGYTERFGVYYVDFNNTAKTRTAKESTKYIHDVIKLNAVPITQNAVKARLLRHQY